MSNLFKINTPFGNLHLLIGIDGARWLVAVPLVDILRLSLRRDILERGDANQHFWRIGMVEGRACVPVDRVTELLKAFRDEHVRKEVRPALWWLRAHAQQVLTGFKAPAPAPRLPMDDPDPARAQPPEPVAPVQQHLPAQHPLQPAAPAPGPAGLISVLPIQIGEAVVNAVNARDLHRFMEIGKDFSTWIKDQVESYGFQEGTDFEVREILRSPESGSAKARPQMVKEYLISLSMAKELAMVQRTPKGKEARLYFIECERRAQAARPEPSRMEIITLAYEAERARMAMADELQGSMIANAAQKAYIAVVEPKAQALDRITDHAGQHLCVTLAAKTLKMGPQQLFAWLERNQWVYRRGNGPWMAYQDKIHSGFLTHHAVEITHTDQTPGSVNQIMVTPKGLGRLGELLAQEAARPVQA